jgi:membrane protease YdiL (CAAX protease family)
MKRETKRNANIAIVLLYAVVFILPYLFNIQNDWFVFLEQPLLIFLPAWLGARFYLHTKEKEYPAGFPGKRPDRHTILLLVVIAVLLFPVINFVAEQFLFLAAEAPGQAFLFVPDASEGTIHAILTFFYGAVYFAVFPGFCEEYLFRGVLLTLMREAEWKTPVILIGNALLFGLFHFNLEQFFYTTVLGLVLTAVVLITNSLYAGMILHFVYNFTVSLPDILSVEAGRFQDLYMGYFYHTDTWLPALLSGAAIVFLLFLLNRKKPGQNHTA